ncbi:carbohydrate ABC transporter permease [Paenarthrobacter aurescens]|jgi:multiple sugar transport system permease protein|uniref:ABC-type sugar transport system, permease component n=1 Tax=Paenarthrobacter aurescens (strain TC1) TaxID=290340 RepID=A1R9N7_PAEAT|nr:carbohydrate ABC transporter permease [Paenarthrobacter aurescens]ABM08508.1 putative ABC-type sugar transport system, permease component [Paenarthrobacter aurescens TC1]
MTTTLKAPTLRRNNPRATGRKNSGYTALAIFFLAIMLFPVYWMVNASLQPNGTTLETSWFPLKPDFTGYATAINEQAGNLGTSLIISLGSVALSLAIAAPAAYALAYFKVRGAGVVLFAILISQMIPGIVVANALYTAYNDLGLLNSIPGLILADSAHGIPFAILIIRAFMNGMPASVIEAARVDGAGHVRAFWSIVLPLSRNSLITAGLFTFLFAWSDFLFALTLTTTEAVRPVTLGIFQYIGAYVNDWSSVMATAVLASIPAIVLLVAAQKYIAAGTTGGAVK